MRIALIGNGFAPGKTGGTETYFRNLVDALQQEDHDSRYTVFVEEQFLGEFTPSANLDVRVLPVPTTVARVGAKISGKLRPGGHPANPQAVKAIEQGGYDLVHFPLQVMHPWRLRIPKVLTFMDMQHEFFPENFSERTLIGRSETYRPSAMLADHVIAISDYTKNTLEVRYGLPADKVTTVYIPYDDQLFRRVGGRADLELPEKFFFYPAGSWRHKNHARLLRALAIVRERHPDLALVLTGVSGEDAAIDSVVAELGLGKHVVRLGYAQRDVMPHIYSAAIGLVFPSLFEGFGIPLCEAMACGCPIAASTATSIPEVAGDAAIYFDPMDPMSIATSMLSLIEQPDLAKRLAEAGLKRAPRFRKSVLGTRTIEVYRRVARSRAAA